MDGRRWACAVVGIACVVGTTGCARAAPGTVPMAPARTTPVVQPAERMQAAEPGEGLGIAALPVG
ncbi:hypothetical protein [Blastococcus sp. SYSU D00820]